MIQWVRSKISIYDQYIDMNCRLFSPFVIFHVTSFHSILIDLYIGCSQKHLLISFHVSNVKTYRFWSDVSSNIVTLYAMLKDWAILPDHLNAYHNESEM